VEQAAAAMGRADPALGRRDLVGLALGCLDLADPALSSSTGPLGDGSRREELSVDPHSGEHGPNGSGGVQAQI
jgi:hypothetical protein